MRIQRSAAMAIWLFGQFYCVVPVWAAAWQHTVSISVSTEYDSNPAMTATAPRGVWRVLIGPSYTLMGRVDENEITAGVAAQVARSSNIELSSNRESPTLFLNWLRHGETSGLGITSRYTKEATRTSDAVDSVGQVSDTSTRSALALSGNLDIELSERSSLTADVNYEDVSFQQGGGYSDYSTRSGGLRYRYISSEQISSYCRLSGNKYVPADGGDSSSLADFSVGVNWTGESTRWGVEVGKSRFAEGRVSTHGSVETNYTGQRTQLALTAERSILPSGLGGFVKADRINGRWSYALSEYSNTGIDLEQRRSFASSMAVANTNSSSGFWVERALSQMLRMRAYYQRMSIQGGGAPSASSDLIGLTLSYSNPDF